MTNGQEVPTLAPASLSLEVERGDVTVFGIGSTAVVMSADVDAACNGALHIIDTVLLPTAVEGAVVTGDLPPAVPVDEIPDAPGTPLHLFFVFSLGLNKHLFVWSLYARAHDNMQS
jgi:hypothetical protein